MHTLKSWRIQNKSLFSAHFDGIIGHFFRKWARRNRYTQWQSLSGYFERIFVHKNWREGYWQHLVKRRYVPHSRSYRIISHRTDFVWPPRSCDLITLGYYLWGAVKDKCYGDKPETIDVLKDNIREAIGEIQLHTIDNVLKNCTDCVGYCMTSRGSHLNEIIFHY